MNTFPNQPPDEADETPIADPLDVAFAAYLRACDAGANSSRDEFIQQFPELATDLSRLLDAADMIGQYTSLHSDRPNLAETGVWNPGTNVFSDANAETVVGYVDAVDPNAEPNLTLPVEHRAAGDIRPTLPFELGDYRLERILGRGGMGIVYLALQRPLERQVAVKMIRSGLLAEGDEVRRFFAEARAAAKLQHPNIVSVYQFGELGGHHFFSMEYIPGTDLARIIEEQPLDPMLAARYVRDVARAIDYAHRHGLLHRDLKPGNVLIDSSGQVHVTDFGLSKQIGVDSSLTASGVAVGTPAYMAPEQASGHSDRASQRTDVYALGAILFACLTGRPPFQADTMMHTLMQVIHQEPPRLSAIRPGAPSDLETICAKCLEKTPKNRYKCAATLADDLDRFLNGEPITARPHSQLLRAVHWLQGVPLIAAVTGHRVLEVSAGHRRFQAAMLLLMMLIPILAAGLWTVDHLQQQRMPDPVTIASGWERGVYKNVSEEIRQRLSKSMDVAVHVTPSDGSIENLRRLLDYEVDVALVQHGAMRPSYLNARGLSLEHLRVAAPVFDEVVHVLVRDGAEVASINDLQENPVAVGPAESGSHVAADQVFELLGLTPELVQGNWKELSAPTGPNAAIICVGRGSELVSDLLDEGWEFLPFSERDVDTIMRNRHHTMGPMQIKPNDFPGSDVRDEGIATVGTTALLVVREDTPDVLVTAILDILYRPTPLRRDMITKENAAEWEELPWHRAAVPVYYPPQQIESP